MSMKWASVVSEEERLEDAITEAVASVRSSLDGSAPDLALVFVSEHHQEGYHELAEQLGGALEASVLLGCSAGGVIGGGREVEHRPRNNFV